MNLRYSFEFKKTHFTVVLSFLTLLLAFNQPWVTSLDGDSIVYATISKTIAMDGNWLTPVYNSRHFFDHPPLVFWVNAALIKLLGTEEWVMKLFSGFSGLAVVLLVFHIGTRISGPYLGFFAALSMLFTYDFVKYLNKCRLDMPLVLFYTCGLYYFLKGMEGDKKGYYLCGFFAGLSFLTKGIVAFGIFLTSFILLADLKKFAVLKQKEVWLAVLVSIAVPGLWVLAQYLVNGSEFFDSYFSKQVQGSIMGRTRPFSPFYYLIHLLKVYWPWMPFFIHGLAITLKEEEKHPVWRMSLIWCAVVFFAFSFARYKVHYYLLPMFPAMSLLVGRSLDRLLTAEKKLAGLKIAAFSGIAAAFFLAVSPIPMHHNRYPEIYKMAPYLREVLSKDDLIIAYRNQEGITTPSLYLVNDKLRIQYCREPKKLRKMIARNKSKRIILYTSDKNAEENPNITEGFYPFIEENGMRFYSRDPDLKLSGRVY